MDVKFMSPRMDTHVRIQELELESERARLTSRTALCNVRPKQL